MGDDRRIRLALAWIATAAAAGLLFALLLRPLPMVREVVREVPVPARNGPVAEPSGAPGPKTGATAPEERPPAASAQDAGVVPPDPGAPAAWIEVTVRDAGGSPVLGATAYALPAGAPGVDEQDRIPNAGTDEAGRALLPVAAAGAYDVGAFSDALWTLVRDVRAEAGATVRTALTLPAGASLLVQCEGWPPPAQEVPEAEIHVQSSAGDAGSGAPRCRSFPGRGEGRPFSCSLSLDGKGTAHSPPLPEGVPCHFQGDVFLRVRRPNGSDVRLAAPFVLDPPSGKAVPGDTVRLRILEPARAILVVRTEPPLPEGVRLMILTTVVQGGRRSEFQWWVSGPPPDQPSEWEFGIQGHEGPARIEWREFTSPGLTRGAAVKTGAADGVVLGTRAEGRADVVLRIDPSTAGEPPEKERVSPDIPFEFPGLPEARKEDGSFTIVLLPREGRTAEEDPEDWAMAFSEAFAGEHRGRTAMFLLPPDLVSDAMLLPPEGPAVVRLRRGGFLLVAPEFLPSSGLGALTLRRTDGLPVPRFSSESDSLEGVHLEPVVVRGTLLGPFPEGTWAFEVRLGGVRLPDARATVEAGRIEVLRIRR